MRRVMHYILLALLLFPATSQAQGWRGSVNGEETFIGTAARPQVANAPSLGTVTFPWLSLYVKNIVFTTGGAVTLAANTTLGWAGRTQLSSPANGQLNITNAAGTFGVGLDASADAVFQVRTRAQSAYAGMTALYYLVPAGGSIQGSTGAPLYSPTLPTISSGFGSSPSVTVANGTAAFRVNVGTGGAASTGVIGLPTATTGWNCFCTDITTASTTVTDCKQTASTTATATVGNFAAAGTAGAWTASDILAVSCFGY